MIETLSDHLASYSHPFVAGDPAYHRAISTSRSRRAIDAALADGTLQRCSTGLAQLLDRWADEGDVWVPELGGLEEALESSNQDDIIAGAIRLGLRAFGAGFRGDWAARSARPCYLDLGVGSGGDVTHDIIAVTIDTSGAVVNSAHGARSVRPSPAAGASPVEYVGAAPAAARGYPPPSAFGEFGTLQSGASFGTVLADTLGLLRRHAPNYLDWVERGCRCVVAIESDDLAMESGSSRGHPGLVHVAAIAHLPAVAEMLVHESSHQQYYVATLLGPVDDGSDQELYYSPVKRTGRPIANILLAYHAFANVALLMTELLESGVEDVGGWMEQNRRLVLRQAAHLDDALRSTRALTDIGAALYQPLAVQLAAVDA